MSLDFSIKTLIFTIVIGHLFSGILGIAYMIQHKKDSSLYIFLFARLFDTIAWVFLGLRDVINIFISISLGNSFLIIAQTTQIIAFLIIKKRCNKLIKRAYVIASAISIVVIHLAILLQYTEGVRISIMSISMIILWCFPIYVFLMDKNSSVLQKTVAFIYLAGFILLILRAYMGIGLRESVSLMSNNIYNVLFFLCLYLIMLIGNIGFILMAKEKSDLELTKVATYDELTGIFNRREFLLRAKENVSLWSLFHSFLLIWIILKRSMMFMVILQEIWC